jgi:hypothetical protein
MLGMPPPYLKVIFSRSFAVGFTISTLGTPVPLIPRKSFHSTIEYFAVCGTSWNSARQYIEQRTGGWVAALQIGVRAKETSQPAAANHPYILRIGANVLP